MIGAPQQKTVNGGEQQKSSGNAVRLESNAEDRLVLRDGKCELLIQRTGFRTRCEAAEALGQIFKIRLQD